MDNQEEDVQVEQETVEQEETTQDNEESQSEDTIVITKEKFKAMQEKAIKFDEAQKHPKPKTNPSVTPVLDDSIIARIYGLNEDDIQEVKDIAAIKKVTFDEALKLGATKAILAEKAEFRKTAEVSNTGNARRSVSKVSDDTLIANLSKGEVPKPGSPEAEQLFWAKRGGKR